MEENENELIGSGKIEVIQNENNEVFNSNQDSRLKNQILVYKKDEKIKNESDDFKDKALGVLVYFGTIAKDSGENNIKVAIGQQEGDKIFFDRKDIRAIYKIIRTHNKHFPDNKIKFVYEFTNSKTGNVYARAELTEKGWVVLENHLQYFDNLEEFNDDSDELGISELQKHKSLTPIITAPDQNLNVAKKAKKLNEEELLLLNILKTIYINKTTKEKVKNGTTTDLKLLINKFEIGEATASFELAGFRGQNPDMVEELDKIKISDNMSAITLSSDLKELTKSMLASTDKKSHDSKSNSKATKNLSKNYMKNFLLKLNSNIQSEKIKVAFTDKFPNIQRAESIGQFHPPHTPVLSTKEAGISIGAMG